MAYIGARLRHVRLARGLTQEQLAELVPGMTRTDISNAERDRLSIGPGRLARLADALRVSRLELEPEVEPDEHGLVLHDRQEQLEAQVLRLVEDVRRLTRRVRALERREPPQSPEALGA